MSRIEHLSQCWLMNESREQSLNNFPVNIGQPEVATPVSERQPRVIEPEQMKNRRMEIMDMHFVFGDLHSIIIRLAVDRPASHSSAGQP